MLQMLSQLMQRTVVQSDESERFYFELIFNIPDAKAALFCQIREVSELPYVPL